MAQEDTKKSVQTLLNNSHNETFNMQEVIAYGSDGSNISALSVGGPGLSNGSKEGITLTNANTCYLCPASTPATDYTIQLYNSSDTDMYISPDSTASNGVLFKSGGTFVYDLKADEPLYLYCGTAGKAVSAIKWARA